MPGVSTAEGLMKMPSVLRRVFSGGRTRVLSDQSLENGQSICEKEGSHCPRFSTFSTSLTGVDVPVVLVYLAGFYLYPMGPHKKLRHSKLHKKWYCIW